MLWFRVDRRFALVLGGVCGGWLCYKKYWVRFLMVLVEWWGYF